jgi:hypothetical protein
MQQTSHTMSQIVSQGRKSVTQFRVYQAVTQCQNAAMKPHDVENHSHNAVNQSYNATNPSHNTAN